MRNGLAEYVSLTPCPYPPIVAEWESVPQSQIATFTPPGFTNRDAFRGLGDILPAWNFTTPQHINAAGTGLGDILPVWNFTTPQRINGAGTGLGAIALTSPDGYFSGSVSQWGLAEWGTVATGAYTVISAWEDSKKIKVKAAKGRQKLGKAAKSAKKGGMSGLAIVGLVGLVAGGVYLYSQANTAAVAQ